MGFVTHLYRFTDNGFDGGKVISQHKVSGNKAVYLLEYPVLRVTRMGWWIRKSPAHGEYSEKWVSAGKGKRFAYPTKAEALQSYRRRKQRQIEILDFQLMEAYKLREIAKVLSVEEESDETA